MANRYYGDFRSNDTTVDPNGQKYRVVIFTGYNNTVPCEEQLLTRPAQGGLEYFIGYVPINNFQITMSDQPFTVDYEGDTDNVYKPYRCSTASVSFLQSSLNTEFLNSNGTSTLVLLLKWNNDVYQSGNRMVNRSTGATISKRVVRDRDITFYNNFVPAQYDRFCYTVEWVGYATPETFSMSYDHVTDVFTLNCQDALTVLQYSRFHVGENNSLLPLKNVLLDTVGSLGTYKKVYVTKSVSVPTIWNDVVEDFLNHVRQQSHNTVDESGKESDNLTVLSQMLVYCGLVAIPHKDILVVTTPNAIAKGYNYYNVYTLPTSNYIMNFGGGEYSEDSPEFLSHNYTVTADSYTSAGTQISTTDTYNSVKVECDEYDVDLLLPDINDNKNLKDHEYWLTTYTEGQAPQTPVAKYWEHESYNSNTPDLILYQRDYSVGDHQTNWAIFDTVDLHRPNLAYYPTAYILDDGGVHEGTSTTCLQQPYNPKRRIFITQGFRGNSSLSGADNDTFRTMMIAKTKRVLLSEEQYLFIEGEWTFYQSSTMPTGGDNSNMNADYSYVRAKIRCADKWLANDGTDSYGWKKYKWVDEETVVKLYLKYEADKKAWQTAHQFAKNTRNFDGIVVPLPVDANNVAFGAIQVEFGRPVGCGYMVAWSAALDKFKFEIHNKAYYESRGKDSTSSQNSNTEYKTEMTPDAVSEYETQQLNLSTSHEKGVRYSQTCAADDDGTVLIPTPKVYNIATGNYAEFEQHITTNIANQYKKPTTVLRMPLKNELTPYSRVTWGQMSGKVFVTGSMSIDYANETDTVTLCEVKDASLASTTRNNRTRNYHRTRDLIFNAQLIPVIPETLDNDATLDSSRSFSHSPGSTNYYIHTNSLIEGCMAMQPQFNNDGNCLLVSVPNDIAAHVNASKDSSNNLILTFTE